MLDTVRYYLALLVILTFPFALVFWLIVHPFVAFWRRLGPAITYTTLFAVFLVVAVLTYRLRADLLVVEYGTNRVLQISALLAYLVAVWIEVRCRRHLKLSILVGLPELRPAADGGVLLREGIYGRIRHPRYAGILFATLAVALFCNYLAIWIMAAAFVPGLLLVIHFEERELRRRFGADYVGYAEQVPRLIPRVR